MCAMEWMPRTQTLHKRVSGRHYHTVQHAPPTWRHWYKQLAEGTTMVVEPNAATSQDNSCVHTLRSQGHRVKLGLGLRLGLESMYIQVPPLTPFCNPSC